MTTQQIDGCEGLITERSELSNQALPNSVKDCRNVVFSRDGFAVSRHGHPPIYSEVSLGSFSTKDMRALVYVNGSESSFVIPFVTGTAGNAAFFNGTTITSYSAISGSAHMAGEFAWGSQYQTFTLPRRLAAKNRLYFTASNGLFRSTDTTYSSYTKAVLPLVKSLTATTVAPALDDQRWFQAGFRCKVVALIAKKVDENIYVEGKPSRVVEVTNTLNPRAISLTLTFDSTSFNGDSTDVIKIYRTLQYPATQTPEVSFYQCYPDMSLGSVASPVTVTLTLNDDAVSGQEEIYTSQNRDGLVNRNSAPPTCRDALTFKNYGVYANVYRQPYGRLQMTALPSASSQTVTIEGISVAVPQLANSTTAPPSGALTTGIIDTVNGSYTGTATGYYTCIRPFAPNATSAADSYSVPYYAVSAVSVTVGAAGSTVRTIKITPSTSIPLFDVQRFTEPGIAAYVDTSGFVRGIFSYQGVEQIPNGAFIQFTECTAFGVPFGAGPYDATADYFLYFLPGTSVTALPVYAIGAIATFGTPGFSLLPTYEKYPTRPGNQIPVGIVTNLSNDGVGHVLADIQFLGIYARSAGQLLDDTVKQVIDNYNAARTADLPYAEYLNEEPATIYFEGVFSGYNFNRAATNKYYDSINASCSASAGSFQPALTTTPTNISFDDCVVRNGLEISKANRPEAIPNQYLVTPIRVGADDWGILRVASNNDSVFVLKDKEGIYRLNISDGGSLPQIDSNILMDNTTYLIAPESVQEINESVYFLSQKGFIRLRTSAIDPISQKIESEIRELSSRVDLTKVRSFRNELRRLYGCYFPGVNADGTGVTYVYDTYTSKWSKWALPFDSAYGLTSGKLTTITTDYNLVGNPETTAQVSTAALGTKYWQYLRQDVQSAGLNTDADQYDELIPLTGATGTNVGGGIGAVGNTVTFIRTASPETYPCEKLSNITSRLKNKDLWYKIGSATYRVTLTAVNYTTGSITLKFTDFVGTAPAGLDTTNQIVCGVSASVTFNAFLGSGTGTLKHFSEFQINTDNSPTFIGVSFRVDTQTGLNTSTTFNTMAVNRTVWRTYIPLSSSRGRFLIRSISHSTPFQNFRYTGQTLVYRESPSTRVAKN